jgi:hypothetical protein
MTLVAFEPRLSSRTSLPRRAPLVPGPNSSSTLTGRAELDEIRACMDGIIGEHTAEAERLS